MPQTQDTQLAPAEVLTPEDIAGQRARLRLVFRVYLMALVPTIVGSLIIVPFFISQETACALSQTDWFTSLWRANLVDARLLAKHPESAINACRLLTATSWSGLIADIVFIVRIVIEIKYGPRKFQGDPFQPKIVLFTLFFTLLSLLSAGFFPNRGMTLDESHGFMLYGLSVFSNPVRVHIMKSLHPLISLLLVSESFSIILMMVRYKLRHIQRSNNHG